jgi:hypothetical protein
VLYNYRYTDFLVNEVLPSGKVLHLLSINTAPNNTGNKGTGAVTNEASTSEVKPAIAAPEAKTEPSSTKSETAGEFAGKDEKTHDVNISYTFSIRNSN